MLLFCTNNTCSSPLHVLLTEAVLCHGGTLELIHILNRLGAVASVETLNRLSTHVVQTQLSEGLIADLEPQEFAAVSIDNIDILQPYGFVSCLDATRSWHGTSVQSVQPLPLSGHLRADDLLSTRTAGITTKKRTYSSPVNTPVPREKHKRRQRTLTEQHPPHSTIQQEPTALSSSNYFHDIDSEYSSNRFIIHLEDFKPSTLEQSALDSLQNDFFHCLILRKAGSVASTQPFPALQSLVNCVRKQACDKEVSCMH